MDESRKVAKDVEDGIYVSSLAGIPYRKQIKRVDDKVPQRNKMKVHNEAPKRNKRTYNRQNKHNKTLKWKYTDDSKNVILLLQFSELHPTLKYLKFMSINVDEN